MRPGTLLRWNALKYVLKAQITGDEFILDVGGCDGFIANRLTKSYPNIKIAIIDNDFQEIRKARESGGRTLQAAVEHLPIKKQSIDILLCLDILEHLKNERNLFEEISRVLKKEGKIILTTPMKDGVSFPLLSKKRIDQVNRSWGHETKGYSFEHIESFFNSSGLVIEKSDGYFNYLTRFFYRFAFISKVPMPGIKQAFKLIILLEPLWKFGAQEHIIIGKKVS